MAKIRLPDGTISEFDAGLGPVYRAAPEFLTLSKACAEADEYLAKHPEDRDIVEKALALQIGKKAQAPAA